MDRRDFLKLGTAAALWPGLTAPFARAGRTTDATRLEIGADPRLELYGVVLYLGPFRGLKNAEGVIQARVVTPFEFAYKREVDARFGRFKDHPAVKLTGEMAEQGLFRLGHPPAIMLHLTNPPGLEERIPVDDFLLKMAGGRNALDAFLAAMREFARDSEFMAFSNPTGTSIADWPKATGKTWSGTTWPTSRIITGCGRAPIIWSLRRSPIPADSARASGPRKAITKLMPSSGRSRSEMISPNSARGTPCAGFAGTSSAILSSTR